MEMDNDWKNNSPEKVVVDGKTFLLIPEQSEVVSKEGEFMMYDDTQGHCALCGRLTCKQTCFK
tara:strand:- start:6143 stop:6331 length:189 start_codon:yes stop_codon:yes gene_type:complete